MAYVMYIQHEEAPAAAAAAVAAGTVNKQLFTAMESKEDPGENAGKAAPAAASPAQRVNNPKAAPTDPSNAPVDATKPSTETSKDSADSTEAAPPTPIQSSIIPVAKRLNFVEVISFVACCVHHRGAVFGVRGLS